MKRYRRLPLIVATAVIVLCGLTAAQGLPAQTGTGTLRGTLVDPSRGAVVNVPVQATTPGGQTLTATTNDVGVYELKDLAPGTYTVFFGLFVGETRMKVTSGPNDNDNRIDGGPLRVQ